MRFFGACGRFSAFFVVVGVWRVRRKVLFCAATNCAALANAYSQDAVPGVSVIAEFVGVCRCLAALVRVLWRFRRLSLFSAFLGFGEKFSFWEARNCVAFVNVYPQQATLGAPVLADFAGVYRRLSLFVLVCRCCRCFSFTLHVGVSGVLSVFRGRREVLARAKSNFVNVAEAHSQLAARGAPSVFSAWPGMMFWAASNCIAVVDTQFQQAMPGGPVLAVFLAFFDIFGVFRCFRRFRCF